MFKKRNVQLPDAPSSHEISSLSNYLVSYKNNISQKNDYLTKNVFKFISFHFHNYFTHFFLSIFKP